jgi:hypothetical protein
VKLAAYLDLVQEIRMRGAIPIPVGAVFLQALTLVCQVCCSSRTSISTAIPIATFLSTATDGLELGSLCRARSRRALNSAKLRVCGSLSSAFSFDLPYSVITIERGGQAVACLRHHSTSRKVVGWIPDEVL